jgi:hypothetical protein
MYHRACGSDCDCAGMSAAVRASAGGYGRGPLGENRLSLGSMRAKGNAKRQRWKEPRVGRVYVRI